MELKNYQKQVLNDLVSYMNEVSNKNNICTAWNSYWNKKDINVGFGGVPSYNNSIPGVPHVCMKVPTAGGKTFIACSSLKYIFENMPLDKPKVVVWLVPSDSILTQTINALSNVDHPYRQKLDNDFAGKVGIYTKDQLLNGINFSPDTITEMLTICILSYNSLRVDSRKKDIRKVYQENGNLFKFHQYFNTDETLISDNSENSLIEVLRKLSPVTIVDESHNASSDLSVEMLKNLNPSFVLDLTATPRKNSNIISYVDVRELKKEHMVKLPVVVYNRSSRQNVIQDAIQLCGNLEKLAIEEEKTNGNYIRPIILFQAQPKTSEESETFEKIKNMLIEMGIPEDEIAIKTSNIDELYNINLMSKNCKIRYIITVNALKEGWDCPFAYILASLANKSSAVDVEQIVGRVLRQPYTTSNSSSLLNTSYVLTSSTDFRNTLESIISGLNKAGFSKKDYRVAEDSLITNNTKEEKEQFVQTNIEYANTEISENIISEDNISENPNSQDLFEDIKPSEIKNELSQTSNNTNDELSMMLKMAEKETSEYNKILEDSNNDTFIGGELGNMLNQNQIQEQYRDEIKELKIPQFFIKSIPDLFGNELELLEPESLSDGFSLTEQDAQINFELETGEMYQVDIQDEGDTVPKYKRVSKEESQFIRDYLSTFPEEKKIQICTSMICKQINKNNRYLTSEIEDYVHRIINNMSEDELNAMENAIPVYAKKIEHKIENLEEDYREKQFNKFVDNGKIVCKENYILPNIITPASSITSIPSSLYEAEKNDMNNFELKTIDLILSKSNIKWWHRIIDRKGFRINGFINHYPDFMIMTKSNKIVLVECKGDFLDNDDSKQKLKLGRKWQSLSGNDYRYFMVFENKELNVEGAYNLDNFIEIMKDL